MTPHKPLVSTITPVLNGEKYIAENLRSIQKQTYPHIEMIVVDNYSTDQTRQIAKSFGAQVYLHGPERTNQDNFGVEKAKGKYVFITGCDMVLDRDYIRQAVKLCEQKKIDAVYAHVATQERGFWSKVKGLERRCYINDPLHEAARFLRRDLFLKLGGFRTDLVLHGDDYDLQKRLDRGGYRTGTISALETHIDEIDSLQTIFLKSFYYGFNSKKYLQENPVYAIKQLSPLRGAFFRHWKVFIRHPVLSGGLTVFKLIQYSCATAGLFFALMGGKKIAHQFHNRIYRKAA